MNVQRKIQQDIEGIGLEALLSVALKTRPDELFCREPARREAWAGASKAQLTHAEIDDQVRRLAALVSLSRLPEGSHSVIMAPMGPEQVIATLASRRAGLRPLLLPMSANAAQLQVLIDSAGPCVVLATTRCGDLEPALMLRDAAARSFNARLVCAFGPDVPDGVVPLDKVIASPARLPDIRPVSDGFAALPMVIETAYGVRQSVMETDIFAATLAIARVARLNTSARVLSMMMSPNLCALASGPYLALLSGAEYLPLGLFSLSSLWAGLADGVNTCLIAPASTESALRKAGIIGHDSVTSLMLIHRQRPGALEPSGDHSTRMFDLFSNADHELELNQRQP